MRTIKNILFGALLLAASLYPSTGKAQISLDSYFNVDWQFNIPIGNDFSNGASGWGMNLEGGYYVTQEIAIGGFMNFHTNNEYFPRRTIALSETLSMNSRQQHQMFTLPFGALIRYRFVESDFQPYVGMKLGMCYSEFNNYYYIFEKGQDRWGFYMSPEVGFNYYPWPNGMGFHMALYYSFATNKCNIMSYEQSTLNNIGFRLGLAF
ncbi:MAG: outer membrane beta-barrel protein [Bacteroidaceae bacterium]|nr:outer membrane beta-barrel protein [Bacteroidaceae bacterium]MBR5275604.1 outer membrane beta-barrel protein [Bacteroidaceae bacterium]MBR5891891.1 outer membrane beta-barrel protein [Bacteroidaceae bacterium]